MSYRHLLPAIAVFALGLTSCGDDAAEVTTVEAPVAVTAPEPEPEDELAAALEEEPVAAPDRAVANTPAIESDALDAEGGMGEGADYLTPEEVRYQRSNGTADWSDFDLADADGFDDVDTGATNGN